jgi:hypothetical protein
LRTNKNRKRKRKKLMRYETFLFSFGSAQLLGMVRNANGSVINHWMITNNHVVYERPRGGLQS